MLLLLDKKWVFLDWIQERQSIHRSTCNPGFLKTKAKGDKFNNERAKDPKPRIYIWKRNWKAKHFAEKILPPKEDKPDGTFERI
jgi:hypothetical protein